MLEPQETRIWQVVMQSGLASAEEMKECWEKIPPEKRTADAIDRRLARRLVEAGHLTLWQAQQLMSGVKPQSLWYDKYVLENLLGQGGMGRVYLARDSRLGRRVAVKILSRERMNNPRAIARFRREARSGAQLQHENLVRIYDEGEVNGNLFLVMEYIQGKNLGHMVAERGPLPPRIAARLGRQIALGLEHAHRKGLVHRDVNPMNILVDREGIAKLTDLGLAIDLGDQGDAVTRDGATVGTFDYISPEQSRHSRAIDIRSDIYSLGCTIYHWISGRVPFPQPSLPEKLYAHQMLDAEPLTSINPAVPEGLDQAVRRAMSKRPEERYQTPQEMADALEPYQSPALSLEGIVAAMGSGVATAVPPEPTADRPNHEEKRQPSLSDSVTPSPTPKQPEEPVSIFPEIDMGPMPALMDSGTSSMTGERVVGRPQIWLGACVLAFLIAVLGMVVARSLWPTGNAGSAAASGRGSASAGGADATGTEGAADAEDSGATGAAGSRDKPAWESGAVTVRWLDDGSVTPALNLEDAFVQAHGKRAEVILHGNKAHRVAAGQPLVVSEGSLEIKAAEGSRPQLVLDSTSPQPLFQVNPRGKLTLTRVTFQWDAEAIAKTPAQRKAARLAVAHGDLALVRCRLEAKAQGEVEPPAISVLGLAFSAEGCVFHGFSEAIEIQAMGGHATRLQNCLFVGNSTSSQVDGCPIRLVASATVSGRKTERDLRVERCVVLGNCLLSLENATSKAPVHAEVVRSVVMANSLLDWTGASAFPDGLIWTGLNNRYEIQGSDWVRRIAGGPIGKKSGASPPRSLQTWIRKGIEEAGSREGPITFQAATNLPFAQRSLADFVVSDEEQPESDLGIDPRTLGPE